MQVSCHVFFRSVAETDTSSTFWCTRLPSCLVWFAGSIYSRNYTLRLVNIKTFTRIRRCLRPNWSPDISATYCLWRIELFSILPLKRCYTAWLAFVNERALGVFSSQANFILKWFYQPMVRFETISLKNPIFWPRVLLRLN